MSYGSSRQAGRTCPTLSLVRAEQAKCGHCGAALPLSTGPIVVCGYCGRESRLVAQQQPAPLSPAPLHPAPAVPPAGTGSPVVLLALGSVAALILIGVALSFGLGVRSVVSPPTSGGSTPPRPASDPRALRFWRTAELALLHGDGAVASVAGVAAQADGATRLTLLAGDSGQVRWQAPAPNGITVYADGGDVLFSFDPAKKVRRYDAKTGNTLWTITVAGHVHDITFGSSCAALMLGGEPLGIDTASGQPASCQPAQKPLLGRYKFEPRDVRLKAGELDVLGGLQLDSAPVNPQPPRFALSASKSGAPAWRVVPTSLEPIWSTDGFHRTVTLTPAGVFVFGRDSATHGARWLLLEAASGRVVYERKAETKVKQPPRLAASGPLVFVTHDNALEAIQAADGELAWRIGD